MSVKCSGPHIKRRPARVNLMTGPSSDSIALPRLPPNTPAEARRGNDVRVQTKALTRRCLQPDSSMMPLVGHQKPYRHLNFTPCWAQNCLNSSMVIVESSRGTNLYFAHPESQYSFAPSGRDETQEVNGAK